MRDSERDVSKNLKFSDTTSKAPVVHFPPLSPAHTTEPSFRGQGENAGRPKPLTVVCLGPGSCFRPTKGLCMLFNRTGTRPRRTRIPPAPPPKPHLTSPSRSFAEVVRRGRIMAAPGNGGFGRGGRGYDARYDLGFQPGFNPGRGGRGGGQGFASHRGRGGFSGYYNQGTRNSGAHFYGGERPYGGDRGNGRHRGRGGGRTLPTQTLTTRLPATGTHRPSS